MGNIISASHDIVFKALFVRNPDILRAFLKDVLDLPLTENDTILILNPELIPDESDGKMGRLDIHVEIGNRKFNIEMQAREKGFSVERILYYISKMFSDGFKAGEKYEDLEKTYSVNVLGYNFLECEEYYSSYSFREDKRYEQLTDKLSIHIFELPKLPKNIANGDNKQLWMKLIKADSEEALEMVRTATTNPAIQQGVNAIYTLSADEELREKIRQREKALNDYGNDIAVARDEGIAIGEIKGRAEGITIGEIKGKADRDNELIAKWKSQGFTDEQIRNLLG